MAYNASKAAVRLMTKSVAVQHAKDKIRANSVHPGIMSPMRTSGRTANPAVRKERMRVIPMGRPGEVDEVAYAILFLASGSCPILLVPRSTWMAELSPYRPLPIGRREPHGREKAHGAEITLSLKSMSQLSPMRRQRSSVSSISHGAIVVVVAVKSNTWCPGPPPGGRQRNGVGNTASAWRQAEGGRDLRN